MNVMMVGLASIAAYLVIMVYWINVDKKRDEQISASQRRDEA